MNKQTPHETEQEKENFVDEDFKNARDMTRFFKEDKKKIILDKVRLIIGNLSAGQGTDISARMLLDALDKMEEADK